MLAALKTLLRHAVYALRGGFLVRPLATALVIGAFGIVIPFCEREFRFVDPWVARLPVLAITEASTAQSVLGAIIGAIMTVVSIVLSVLLVALTFASIQFSPRILTAFVEDKTSQRTIGLFLGTFLYSLCVFPATSPAPPVRVPTLSLLGAIALAVACSAALVTFIFHMARSINVNFITERIATETERVIDDVMPEPLRGRVPLDPQPVPAFRDGPPINSAVSGYIRFIDGDALRALAVEHGVALAVERRVGQFVPAGAPLFRFSKPKEACLAAADEFLKRFDIGPVRTMEQDIEFGVLQLVDIALKAISPAVNDPSTAINCIDQLSRLLVRVAGREPAAQALYEPPGVVRVVFPALSFGKLVDTAYGQILHYGSGDAAVVLRVLRALGDIASATTQRAHLAAVRARVEKARATCEKELTGEARAAFEERLERVLTLTDGQRLPV